MFVSPTFYTGPNCPKCKERLKASDGNYQTPDPPPAPFVDPSPTPDWGSSASDFGAGGVSGADGG